MQGKFFEKICVTGLTREGRTIENIIDETGVISAEKAVKYADQILEGLSGIHECGIVHKDISSNNVIIDDHDEVWIIDFDISRKYKP